MVLDNSLSVIKSKPCMLGQLNIIMPPFFKADEQLTRNSLGENKCSMTSKLTMTSTEKLSFTSSILFSMVSKPFFRQVSAKSGVGSTAIIFLNKLVFFISSQKIPKHAPTSTKTSWSMPIFKHKFLINSTLGLKIFSLLAFSDFGKINLFQKT